MKPNPQTPNDLAKAVRSALTELNSRQKIFCFERDFQRGFFHALKNAGVADIECEAQVKLDALGKCRIDILGGGVAVELKYKPKGFCVEVDGEVFSRERKDEPVFDEKKWEQVKTDLCKIALLLMADKAEVGFFILLVSRRFADGVNFTPESILPKHKFSVKTEKDVWSKLPMKGRKDKLITNCFLVEVRKKS